MRVESARIDNENRAFLIGILAIYAFTPPLPGGSRGGPGGVTGNPARPTPPSPANFEKFQNSKRRRHGENARSLVENERLGRFSWI